jgi:hypothetical protein
MCSFFFFFESGIFFTLPLGISILSELQPNQAVNIHVNNVEYLHCNTRDKQSTKDGVRKSDIESDSGQSLLKGNSLCHSIFDTSKTWTPEDLLTDEFLDKMLIPKGNVKKIPLSKKKKKEHIFLQTFKKCVDVEMSFLKY